MITTTLRQHGTLCPMCDGLEEVVLVKLESIYLSTRFALCRECREKLAEKLLATPC